MKATLSFLVSVTLILVASVSLGGQTAPPPASPAPPLTPSEYVWFFGFIPEGSWVSHHYLLRNPHPDTVTILEMIPGCDCTHVPRGPVIIGPGGTYLLETLFDTRTYFDETNRNIRVITNYKSNPNLDLYFGSIASRNPNTLAIVPPSTAFIPGKQSQSFVIKNMAEEKTAITVLIDNDSTLTVSETSFDLPGKGEKEIIASPRWERFAPGSTYTCLVLEVNRKETFRVSIPIKINKF